MPILVFVHPDGRREAVQVAAGRSAMEAARDNNVRGIATLFVAA